MNFDRRNEQECINVVTRQAVLRNIVERVEPLDGKKKDLLPINRSVIETEKSPLSVPVVCSEGVKLAQDEEASIFNFGEAVFSSSQVHRKDEMIKTIQPLSIIQAEYQDGVKEKKLSAMEIAEQLAESYRFGVFEGNVYVFDTNHFKLCSQDILEHLIYSVLKKSGIRASGYRFLQDIGNFLKLETLSKKITTQDMDNVRKYIGFRNGYLNLETLKFCAPTSKIFITNFLEVNYVPLPLNSTFGFNLKSISCKNFDKFVTELADGDQNVIDRIYQIIGYIISNDCAAKKLFVMMGVSNSGKSKLGEFIVKLFNDEAVTSIPIGELGGRFSIGDLPGKALCVDLDLPATRISEKTAAKIKSLTGGDVTSAENKFDHRKTFINRAKMLFATNHPIEISEKEYVLRDRFECIPITKTVPKERRISNLLDYFEDEKFFIVMKSIGYYLELVKNNYTFAGDFKFNTAFINNSSGIAMPVQDIIKKFVDEQCLLVSHDQWTYTDILYGSFCKYYEITEETVSYRKFSRLLHQLFEGEIGKEKKRRGDSVSPLSAYKGIVLKNL